jgi:hypothetical protein
MGKRKHNRQFNEVAFTTLLARMSHTIHEHDDKQDYDQTANSLYAATNIVRHYGMNNQHLEQLVRYRERVEQRLTQNYGVIYPTGWPGSIMFDLGKALRDRGVPLPTRIASGLLDTIIGVCAHKVR